MRITVTVISIDNIPLRATEALIGIHSILRTP